MEPSKENQKDFEIPCQLFPTQELDMSEEILSEKLAGVPVGGLTREEMAHPPTEFDFGETNHSQGREPLEKGQAKEVNGMTESGPNKTRVAFLFPGQGAQSLGMGQQLYQTIPAARELFDRASSLLGYDLREICEIGPVELLNSTAKSQPAIFVTSLAALESIRVGTDKAEADCVAAAGLSLGEYTALVFAGAMTFEEGLMLVKQRGEAMQAAAEATPSGMISVLGLEREKVEELCKKASEKGLMKIANLLGPGNIVVSGEKAACDEVERLAEEMGAMKTIRLAVAGAFHTELMKPADETLAQALSTVNLKTPRIPVWSNVDAQPHTDPDEIRSLLVRQVLQLVLWEQTIRNLLAQGIDQFYEIGPGRVLAGLLKRIQRSAKCQNVTA